MKTPCGEPFEERYNEPLVMDQVAFVKHENLPSIEKFGSIALELTTDGIIVVEQISACYEHRFQIEKMNQDTGPFDVA